MDKEDGSDYGLSSGDEADLEALAVQITTPPALKRSAPPYDTPSPKRQRVLSPQNQALNPSQQSITSATKPSPISSPKYPATSALAVQTLETHFRLQGFRLKQEAAIARLLAGGSAVVVFPTGWPSFPTLQILCTLTDRSRWWKEPVLSGTSTNLPRSFNCLRSTGSSFHVCRIGSPGQCSWEYCVRRRFVGGLSANRINEGPGRCFET